MYEVEMKFSVPDVEAFLKSLENLGTEFVEMVEETDQFYQHPCRDFAVTDEGLRIRAKKIFSDISDNNENEKEPDYCITYKGPKIDSETKTRKEIEVPIGSDSVIVQKWSEIFTSLGFTQSGKVHKIRKKFTLKAGGRIFEITLDYLPELVDAEKSWNGFFMEIETQSEKAELDAAKTAILELAKKLPLGENIRNGYLELLYC